MKVKLVFPPVWKATKQYPSIPCLAAYMRNKGIDVEQEDANLDLFDRIFSYEYLSECLQEISQKNGMSAKAELLTYLRDNVEACKETIRSEAAMDMEVYRSCAAFLRSTINVVDSIWGKGESISFGKYTFNGYHNAGNYSICECVHDVMSGKKRSRMAELLRLQIPSLAEGTDLLGLSVTARCQLIPTFLIAAMCKAYNPQIKIVIGGALATRWALKIEVLKPLFEYVDYFSFYEGEHALTVLTKYLEGEARLEDAPSVAYCKDGEIILNPAAEKQLSMDELPTPEYNEKNIRRYFSPTPTVTLFTSRGCYWNRCAFCDHATVYQDCYRVRSTEKILDDIETCTKKYGARYIDINDEAISAPIMRALSKGILDRGLDVIWRNDARLDGALDEQTLIMAQKSGLRMLYFGLESYNERVLKLMNKGIKKENVLPIIKAASNAGIWTLVYIIRGFPTETVEEFGETARFILENRNYINTVEITRFGITMYSDVSKHPEKYGIEPIEYEHMELDPNKYYIPDKSSSLMAPQADAYVEKIRECKEQNTALLHTMQVLFIDELMSLRKREQAGEAFIEPYYVPLYSKTENTQYIVGVHAQQGKTKKVGSEYARMLNLVCREKSVEQVYAAFAAEYKTGQAETEMMLKMLENAGLIRLP